MSGSCLTLTNFIRFSLLRSFIGLENFILIFSLYNITLLLLDGIIFAISFTATRDILISIIITSAFFIVSNVLFHEESKHCIIPKRMKRIKALIDTNNDGHISAQEEEKALEILKRADKQRKKNVQGAFLSHLATTSTLI